MPTIRPATPSDLPGLFAVRNTPTQLTGYLSQARAPGVYFLLLEQDSQPRAFALLHLNQPLAARTLNLPRFSDLYVQPQHRSQGLGSALIAHMEGMVHAAGFDELWLSVNPYDNPRALALYQRLGYQLDGEAYQSTAIYYDQNGPLPPVREWRQEMVKRLAGSTQDM